VAVVRRIEGILDIFQCREGDIVERAIIVFQEWLVTDSNITEAINK
jgi:hypothetical protein